MLQNDREYNEIWMRRSLGFLGFKALFFYLCPLDWKILFLLLFPTGVTLEIPLCSVEDLIKVPKDFFIASSKVISPENYSVVLLESS